MCAVTADAEDARAHAIGGCDKRTEFFCCLPNGVTSASPAGTGRNRCLCAQRAQCSVATMHWKQGLGASSWADNSMSALGFQLLLRAAHVVVTKSTAER